jgi:hypothetical protein
MPALDILNAKQTTKNRIMAIIDHVLKPETIEEFSDIFQGHDIRLSEHLLTWLINDMMHKINIESINEICFYVEDKYNMHLYQENDDWFLGY